MCGVDFNILPLVSTFAFQIYESQCSLYYFICSRLSLQADIVNEKLTLALEPEAASICCQRISVDSKDRTILPGLQYIVIDIGGKRLQMLICLRRFLF
jgi:hypothetical protein